MFVIVDILVQLIHPTKTQYPYIHHLFLPSTSYAARTGSFYFCFLFPSEPEGTTMHFPPVVLTAATATANDEASGGARGASAPPTHPEHVEFS